MVAIMDGLDPDAGTSWEVGYAFRKKPIVLVRTDMRIQAGEFGEYDPMLTEAATIRIDLPAASDHGGRGGNPGRSRSGPKRFGP